ncbi:DNA cytosine methyltransferase [Bacillus haynesii]|uniref:DNA cytosine methyltransferase n=1 Tax=Bacillus haynesii TaxID=1925021 RepID=UPI0022828AFD|nr:DNA cytosine methyltransferase [Bacillus haynesii]MCY7780164.1 DNA cytosine methyltransferase [Bacillus haynesii]MEC0672797.1 DNA cytosine methyltransferase [Bacillus haynesii]
MEIKYKVLHLFCGIGGGALGFDNAKEEYRGVKGKFETICGIDVDPEACEDFRNLTGRRIEKMDLFNREQYIQFHGQEPPAGWKEVTPKMLRDTVHEIPDVVFTSPPCKGFSGLLPEKSAKTQKYQALNKLTVRSIKLTLEAFQDALPALILLENVPRIVSRGRALLREIKQQLEFFGYVINEDKDNYHDCGEIGGLAQHRKRFLLIARNPNKLDSFVYQPPKQPMKTIGDVIGPLPLPGDKRFGKIHALPNLQWKTWVRLALIPAGGDWRDLEKIDWKKYRIGYLPRAGCGKVGEWDKPCGTITGAAGVSQSNSTTAISDPRTGFKLSTHQAIYRGQKWEDAGRTVTGAMRPNTGALCVNDPRLDCKPRAGTMGVQRWDKPSKTVTGANDVHAGTSAVADPRIPEDNETGVFIIISEDGTWHRPLTTLELAVLQGLPTTLPDGRLLILAGKSDARWRERIGNMVPVAAAQAIAETMLRTMLAQEVGEWLMSAEDIWVVPLKRENEVSFRQS